MSPVLLVQVSVRLQTLGVLLTHKDVTLAELAVANTTFDLKMWQNSLRAEVRERTTNPLYE